MLILVIGIFIHYWQYFYVPIIKRYRSIGYILLILCIQSFIKHNFVVIYWWSMSQLRYFCHLMFKGLFKFKKTWSYKIGVQPDIVNLSLLFTFPLSLILFNIVAIRLFCRYVVWVQTFRFSTIHHLQCCTQYIVDTH